jgi:hypothetical protein
MKSIRKCMKIKVPGFESSDNLILTSIFLNNFLFPLKFLGRFGRVIIESKDGDDNLIRKEVWQELRMLDDLIQNATVTYEGETFTYRDTCAKWEDECYTNDILNLDAILDEVESGELNLTWPIMFNPVSWDGNFSKKKYSLLSIESKLIFIVEFIDSPRFSGIFWWN